MPKGIKLLAGFYIACVAFLFMFLGVFGFLTVLASSVPMWPGGGCSDPSFGFFIVALGGLVLPVALAVVAYGLSEE